MSQQQITTVINQRIVDQIVSTSFNYQGGQDIPHIERVRANFNALNATKCFEVYALLVSYYKSLPLTSKDDVNKIYTQNESDAAGFADSAPMIQRKSQKDLFATNIDLLFQGVPIEFRNWAIAMRALAPVMEPVAKGFSTFGNLEQKWIGQRGWFLFYFAREESKKFLDAQTYITIAIVNAAALKIKNKAVRRDPPVKFSEWLALLDDIPNHKQPARSTWETAVAGHFKDPKPLTITSSEEMANYLQAWLIIRPGRMLLDRDQIKSGGKFIEKSWGDFITKRYLAMMVDIRNDFKFPELPQKAKTQKELNTGLAVHFRVVRNLCAAYRQKFFGSAERRLKGKEARVMSNEIAMADIFATLLQE